MLYLKNAIEFWNSETTPWRRILWRIEWWYAWPILISLWPTYLVPLYFDLNFRIRITTWPCVGGPSFFDFCGLFYEYFQKKRFKNFFGYFTNSRIYLGFLPMSLKRYQPIREQWKPIVWSILKHFTYYGFFISWMSSSKVNSSIWRVVTHEGYVPKSNNDILSLIK